MRKIYNKNFFFIFLAGLTISIIFSNFIINKYDNIRIREDGTYIHSIVRSDIAGIFDYADSYKKNLEKNEFFKFDKEYYRSFLPQIFVGLYYHFINEEIYETVNILDKNTGENKKIKIHKSKNSKFGFLALQSILYFSCLFFLFKKLKSRFSSRYLTILFLFLSLEPTIIQYHSSFFTESIYLSFIIILLIFIFSFELSYIGYFFFGLLLGFMYAQRSISIGLWLPIIFYIIYVFRDKSYKPIIFLMLGMLIIVSYIGYTNFKRSDTFYVTPYQAKSALFHYFINKLISKKENINLDEVKEYKKKLNKNWIERNKLNLEYESAKIKLYNLQNDYAIKIILKYPFESARYHIWKTFQTMMIDPFQVIKDMNLDKTKGKKEGTRYWKLKSKKYYFYLSIVIIYSLIIYFISLVGLVSIISDFRKKILPKNLFLIYMLFILIIAYFLLVSGWMGNPRYFTPCMPFLLFFTSRGIEKFFK